MRTPCVPLQKRRAARVFSLLRFTNGYRVPLVLGPVMVILEVLFEVMIPFLMSRIIDVGIANSDLQYIVRMGLYMIGLALISLVCGAVAARFSAKATMGFAKNLRKGLFEKVQEYSFMNIDRFSTSSLVMRLTTDVSTLQNAFLMMIRTLVRAPVMLVAATFMAFSINSRLVSIFLIAIPVLAVALGIIMKLAFPRFQSLLRIYDDMNASVQENLIGIRVVKSFVRSDHEKKKFSASSLDVLKAGVRAESLVITNFPIMMLIMYSCIIAIMWFGGNMIISGSMLTGQLISFISYVSQILISLMMISMVFVMLVLSRASIQRIREVFNEKIDITDDDADPSVTPEDGSVDFENVTFSYKKGQTPNVLQDISLHISSGETIGLIGGTGSSKSTLVSLIPRLYDATEGVVKVGGHDVKDYKIETLRDSVSVVLQKNVLFSGTIKDNLRWGNEHATDEEIAEACRAAAADEFIRSFPNGYETDLGQGGVNVSGGQKQRLCIARALLKKPKVIILDDSTSAVDTATDQQIQEAFREKLDHVTTIIIAQRISSVMHADRIIVMDDGRINDIGTHEELLKRNTIYQEVYTSQMKGAIA